MSRRKGPVAALLPVGRSLLAGRWLGPGPVRGLGFVFGGGGASGAGLAGHGTGTGPHGHANLPGGLARNGEGTA